MTSLITNLSVFQGLANDLIKPLQLNYSEDCFCFYVNEDKFNIENIPDITNKYHHSLKCTFIKHKINPNMHSNFSSDSPPSEELWKYNSKCIIFLHGLGSSRLQAFPLVQTLPKEYCLFSFDFSGNGKSDGQTVTYGIRESEDVETVIEYLAEKRGIKEFVIWGRSMGAVAALLYALQLNKKAQNNIRFLQRIQQIKAMVLDSPFYDFEEITKFIANKKTSIPQFLIDVALKCVKEHFENVMYDAENDKNFNPFQIKFNQDFNIKIPSIFLYSLTDDIVPKDHSEKIIAHCKSEYQKIIMDDFPHNQTRPNDVLEKIYSSLKKIQRKYLFNKKKKSKSSLKNSFCENPRSRGISLSTSSRDRDPNRMIPTQSQDKKKQFYEIYCSLKVQSHKKTEQIVQIPPQILKSRKRALQHNQKYTNQLNLTQYDSNQILKAKLNKKSTNEYLSKRRNNYKYKIPHKGELQVLLHHTKYL